MSYSYDKGFQQLIPLLYQAYAAGLEQGFHNGRAIGFVEGISSVKAALSDGLRHGSPECGAAMRGLRNLGLDDSEAESES